MCALERSEKGMDYFMKRKGYLYENIYDFDNIISAFNEVCRNTKNKKR